MTAYKSIVCKSKHPWEKEAKFFLNHGIIEAKNKDSQKWGVVKKPNFFDKRKVFRVPEEKPMVWTEDLLLQKLENRLYSHQTKSILYDKLILNLEVKDIIQKYGVGKSYIYSIIKNVLRPMKYRRHKKVINAIEL